MSAKWKQEFLDTIERMPTLELLEEYFDEYSVPDDYDGCFTDRGRYRRDACQAELRKRITALQPKERP